jgi:hypothetical protein
MVTKLFKYSGWSKIILLQQSGFRQKAREQGHGGEIWREKQVLEQGGNLGAV